MAYYKEIQVPSGHNWPKRISLLMAFIFIISFVLLFRLFQQGVLEHSKYIVLAENQYSLVKVMEPKRGQIYAKDFVSGELYPLATNMEKYAVNVVPKNVKNRQETAEKLAAILAISKEEILAKINNDKLYIPPLKHQLEKEEADKISELKLEGVIITPESVRYYPEGDFASHVLGFVNDEGKGNYGVEGYYDSILKGEGGKIEAEKDAWGRLINISQSQNIRDGVQLILTIDRNVQNMVQEKLVQAKEKYGADNGSIVIIEPKTGAILAMAGNPSFDPNKFNEVAQDNQNIFVNPVIGNAWEPGSIFKPLVMSIGLDTGKVEPDTEEVFSNMVVVQGYEIHTAQDKAFGRETMTEVLENSDNVAMVWLADKIGKDEMYQYIEKYGFGQKTGIDLDTEATGTLPNLKNWREINRANISFGQGISVTPLQIITAISSIADGGKLLKPYIVDKIIEPNGKEITTQVKEIGQIISPETAAKLTGMMVSVVERGHGKRAQVSGYSVAGKTGTAQIPKPEGGYYEDRHTGSFSGFLPAEDPKFAILVRLENPKNVEWAESSAAPVFGEIAQWLVNYYQIQPTKE